MGYVTTEYLGIVKRWMERVAESLDKASRNAKEHAEAGDYRSAYRRLATAAEMQSTNLKADAEVVGESIAAENQPYATDVDVYLDDKVVGGKLYWDYEVESREWGIKSFILRLIKLELEEGELPEWFKSGNFTDLDWEIDIETLYELGRNARGFLQITPAEVFIGLMKKRGIHIYFKLT